MRSNNFIRKEQVAEILLLSPYTILEKARNGEIPCYRLGHRTVLFKEEDIHEYVRKFRVPAKPKSFIGRGP